MMCRRRHPLAFITGISASLIFVVLLTTVSTFSPTTTRVTSCYASLCSERLKWIKTSPCSPSTSLSSQPDEDASATNQITTLDTTATKSKDYSLEQVTNSVAVLCPDCDLCDGSGRILGGIGTVLEWWPIKAYRPCPNFINRGGKYIRSGQGLEEIAFGRIIKN